MLESSCTNILILRPGAVGDTLLSFPVIQALKAQYSNPHVTLVGNAAVMPLAWSSGLAAEVFDYGSAQWSELFSASGIRTSTLRSLLAQIDIAICWLRDTDGLVERNLRTLDIQHLIVAPGRPSESERIHIVDYLARTVGVHVDREAGPLWPSWPIVPARSAHYYTTYAPYVAIHPGSGGARKCWPVQHFVSVIIELWRRGIPVLLLAGPADHERLIEIYNHLTPLPYPGPLKVLEDYPLLSVAKHLRLCRGYLGNDSGITHLAALLGIPTVALFGPSDPHIWRPVGPSVHVLSAPLIENLPVDAVLHTMKSFFLD
ncbi:MAG: glycosyltransferase family 9 protein [Chloroflexi bacterium]|nr:glycosyltransferase family 9 protein [Chloroflexota bacterium]